MWKRGSQRERWIDPFSDVIGSDQHTISTTSHRSARVPSFPILFIHCKSRELVKAWWCFSAGSVPQS